MSRDAATVLPPFSRRHIGPDGREVERMLGVIGCDSLESLIDQTVPESIRLRRPLHLPEAVDEPAALEEIRSLADENVPRRAFIGMGYHNCHVPPVILRNVLENPGWYTAYTPYQAELAQGRLEALLNFQTMVADLTGMEIANASLLDESTAAAEAMAMAHGIKGSGRKFFVADNVHPQTISLLKTRAEPLGVEIVTGPWRDAPADAVSARWCNTRPATVPLRITATSPPGFTLRALSSLSRPTCSRSLF